MNTVLHPWQLLLVSLAGWMNRQQTEVIEYLQEENRVLREQLGDRRLHFTDAQRRRLAANAKRVGRRVLRQLHPLVTPDTLLRWHRQLIARKYDGGGSRRPGRPNVMQEIRRLVYRMASENPAWGYRRIQGALANLGHDVSRGTVANILKEHGIDPAPQRSSRTTWQQFLATHWHTLAAADFFTVEVWMPTGLVRYCVLFVIDLPSRKVEISGITSTPNAAWMQQMARNLTDAFDGFLLGKSYLLHDRDSLFTRAFKNTLASAGVRSLTLPPQSPNLNAHAERFVRSIKSECLDRMILFGDRHLRYVVGQYVKHYNSERNHQGIGNALINPIGENSSRGTVKRHERLGGMLNFYHHRAA